MHRIAGYTDSCVSHFPAMSLCRQVARTISGRLGMQKMLSNPIRAFSLRHDLTPRPKRDFISSDSVDKDQVTPALRQYFAFKAQYKGILLPLFFIRRLCVVFPIGRLLRVLL